LTRLGHRDGNGPLLKYAAVRYDLLMTRYIALLRAVNVGGTGRLPMTELKAVCCDAGFARVETYIASGNVVFESKATPIKGEGGA
jgi:Protein of unknown function (DUF1697)